MNAWTIIVVVVLLGLLLLFSRRAKQRQADQQTARANALGPGTEVMTTSGLYGRIVRNNDDGSVQLAIAPGIEVKWALAALRDVASVPAQYQGPAHAGRVVDGTPISDESPAGPGSDTPDDPVRLRKDDDNDPPTGAAPTA